MTTIDLPALDGPATADLANMTGLNSAPSQPQVMPGLNSTPPTSSQGQMMQSNTSSVSMMPQQQTSTQPLPAASASSAVQPTQPPPPSSTPVPLPNSNAPRATGMTTSAAAGGPPNTAVISTTAHPTPALPNISSTSAAQYPANVANPLSSATPGMAMAPRGPPASIPYNSYVGGMTSSAPAINSQMNPMQPQPAQQMVNYMGGTGSLRHPPGTHSMGPVPGQLVHHQQQRAMMAGQPGMMQLRQRQPTMMHPVHGGSSMMPGQAMGMQHHSHMITHGGQTMGMGGRLMQHNPGMHMAAPNIHLSPYDPRSGMMQPTMISKSGMSIHHHRMANPHPIQHPAMRMAPRPHVAPNHMQYVGDPLGGYQGNMRGGYPVAPGQSALSPHSQAGSAQMMNQQLATTVPTNQQNMLTQQQPPRPPSEPQGSPLPGQLTSAAGTQLQVATPPQQQQVTPPHQQATPSQQHAQGAAAHNVSYQCSICILYKQFVFRGVYIS